MTKAADLYEGECTDLMTLFQHFELSAYRIETREQYALVESLPDHGTEEIASLLASFLHGETLPRWTPENNRWLQLAAAQRQAGREIRRVHLIERRPSDFKRFEFALMRDNVDAGEDVRVVEHDHPDVARRGIFDFWLFDGIYALVFGYDKAGRIASQGPAESVGPYRKWARHALEASVSLGDYLSNDARAVTAPSGTPESPGPAVITIYTDRLNIFSPHLVNDLRKAGVQPVVKVVDEDMDAAVEMFNLTKATWTPVIKIMTEAGVTVLTGASPENRQRIADLLRIAL